MERNLELAVSIRLSDSHVTSPAEDSLCGIVSVYSVMHD